MSGSSSRSKKILHPRGPEADAEYSLAIKERSPKACIACRTRKVKCDKQSPCGNCAKTRLECIFPSPIRTCYRPKRTHWTELMGFHQIVEDLTKALDAERSHSLSGSRTGRSSLDESSRRESSQDVITPESEAWASESDRVRYFETRVGRLLRSEGRSRYLSTSFWDTANEDLTVQQADDVLIKSDTEMADAQDPPRSFDGTSKFPLGSSKVDLQYFHPSPEQIDVHWDTYVGHFDPLVKVLHLPTMEQLVTAVKLRQSLSPPNEALMFAVYWVSLISMPEHVVQRVLHHEKATLMTNYRWAVEQALLNAELDNTQDLATLQAFVLYLASIRRLDETKRAGNLAGMALRIAQSQGLHHDGTRFMLPPFETEQRRRLWWQLCYLDQRASEDYGAESSAWDLAFDTEPPSNVNDEDLIPGSTRPVESKRVWTDSSFCLVRLEFARMNRMIRTGLATDRKDLPVFLSKRHSFTLAEKEQLISRCHHDIHTRYFTNYDPSDPLQYLARSITDMLIAKSRFMLRNPLRPSSIVRSPSPVNSPSSHRPSQPATTQLPPDAKDRQFSLAISILELSTQLESDPRLNEWRWLIYSYFQYLPLAFILTELCVRLPGTPDVDRAWHTVAASVDNWTDDIRSSQNGIILQRLLARAQATRARWQ
ncbi:hypothetical protein P152DRAFT_407767, partial [Eremomyces bilateralis CBS 781.70]